jgi:hypothetical protein
LQKGFLQRIELAVRFGNSFDGGDLPAFHAHRQRQTGQEGFPVHQNRAGSALADPAPVFGAGQSQPIPQDIEKKLIGGYEKFAFLPINDQLDNLFQFFISPSAFPLTPEGAKN